MFRACFVLDGHFTHRSAVITVPAHQSPQVGFVAPNISPLAGEDLWCPCDCIPFCLPSTRRGFQWLGRLRNICGPLATMPIAQSTLIERIVSAIRGKPAGTSADYGAGDGAADGGRYRRRGGARIGCPG